MNTTATAYLLWQLCENMKKYEVNKLTLSAMFLALACILPFFTGQIPKIGTMLCPMHIPILLCGFFCGPVWGMMVGAMTPVLRSFILGMPVMFPTAICMAFELAAYGFTTGFLYKHLPRKKSFVYLSLAAAMLIGRIVWGIAMLICVHLEGNSFGWTTFISTAVITAIPGIILQFVLVPVVVDAAEKSLH